MKPLSALLIALPLALAGCGNKGPLVLPEPEPPTIEVEPESGVPVEVDAPATLPAATPAAALPDPLATDPLLPTGTTGFDPYNPPIDLSTVPRAEGEGNEADAEDAEDAGDDPAADNGGRDG